MQFAINISLPNKELSGWLLRDLRGFYEPTEKYCLLATCVTCEGKASSLNTAGSTHTGRSRSHTEVQ